MRGFQDGADDARWRRRGENDPGAAEMLRDTGDANRLRLANPGEVPRRAALDDAACLFVGERRQLEPAHAHQWRQQRDGDRTAIAADRSVELPECLGEITPASTRLERLELAHTQLAAVRPAEGQDAPATADRPHARRSDGDADRVRHQSRQRGPHRDLRAVTVVGAVELPPRVITASIRYGERPPWFQPVLVTVTLRAS